MAQHFYFKLIPEARKLNHPALDAYLDKLRKDEPIHRWIDQPAEKLKKAVKSGEIQEIYRLLFNNSR